MPERFDFDGFRSPNYTQVPDELFDRLLTRLTGAELKVLMYIVRRTFGFKRESDNISLNQMLSGITTKDGRRLDEGTGVAKSSLLRVLRSLVDKKIVVPTRRGSQKRGNEPTNYRLNIIVDQGRPTDGTPSPGSSSGDLKKRPPLVAKSSYPLDRKDAQGVGRKPDQALVAKSSPQETVNKKQSYTRVTSSRKEKNETPYAELVTYFHEKVCHPREQAPTPKELKQAKDLLADHSPKTCYYLVGFAIERARETHFRMRHFGAVLGYIPEALASREREAARRKAEEESHRRREEEALAFKRSGPNLVGLLTLKIGRFKLDHGRDPTATEVESLRQELAAREASLRP